MNEAAILAARRNLKEISKEEIADALERIIAGPEKKGAVMSEKKRKLVAYHEAGHAIVGALMPEYDPVTKISIVPRGAAGGLTFFAPSEERLESGLYSRTYLENQMAVALGGRIAEELIFGEDDITTGACVVVLFRFYAPAACHAARAHPVVALHASPAARRRVWRLPAGDAHRAPHGDAAGLC